MIGGHLTCEVIQGLSRHTDEGHLTQPVVTRQVHGNYRLLVILAPQYRACNRMNQGICSTYPIKYACGSPSIFVYLQFIYIHVIWSPIFFRVASLALGQSYDCPSASEATLKDMGKTDLYQTKRNHNKAQTMSIILVNLQGQKNYRHNSSKHIIKHGFIIKLEMFIKKTHITHLIAHPWGWAMGCVL